ncbi:MAG: hypothetical protein HRU38_23405 [Saccharospirillaceae bacterium]|nr:hypothetical protein [Saccharospirillaceae bacterium]
MMENQELFLVILAALVAANILNQIVFNPLINKLMNVLFGNPNEASKRFQIGTAKSESSKVS